MSTAEVIVFPARRPTAAIPYAPPPRPADAEASADLLLALEEAPLFPPRIDVEGGQVLASVSGVTHRLTPEAARLSADALSADILFPGVPETAAQLAEAAEEAEREPAPPSPEPERSTGSTGLMLFVIAVTVIVFGRGVIG